MDSVHGKFPYILMHLDGKVSTNYVGSNYHFMQQTIQMDTPTLAENVVPISPSLFVSPSALVKVMTGETYMTFWKKDGWIVGVSK